MVAKTKKTSTRGVDHQSHNLELSVVASAARHLLSGHHRVRASKQLGYQEEITDLADRNAVEPASQRGSHPRATTGGNAGSGDDGIAAHSSSDS